MKCNLIAGHLAVIEELACLPRPIGEPAAGQPLGTEDP